MLMEEKKVRKFKLIVIVLFVLNIVFAVSPLYSEVLATSGKGYLESNGVHLILHLKGSPYEMGFQHGELLKDKIMSMFDEYFIKTSKKRGINKKNMIKIVKKYMEEHIPSYIIEEIKGLADGANIDYDTILLMQSFLDILSIGWSNEGKAINYMFGGCSSFAARGKATEGGILIHARNIDFPDEEVLRKHAVLIVYEPDMGKKMVIPGWAGLIGALTGMNEEGVTLSEDTISTSDDDIKGTPFMLLLRNALQNANTAEELRDLVKISKKTTGYLVLTTSPKDQQIFLMEFNPNIFSVFIPKAGTCGTEVKGGEEGKLRAFCEVDDVIFGTNNPRDENLIKIYAGSENSIARFERWQQLVREYYGKFNVEILKKILSDNYDVRKGKITNPSHYTICTDSNIQSIIMLPEKKEFYLSQGSVPAAKGAFVRYTLDELIGK